MADVQLTTALSGFAQVKVQLDELDKKVTAVGGAGAKTAPGLTTLADKLDKAGAAAQRFGTIASVAITAPLVGAFHSVLSAAGDFEGAFNRISAVLGPTTAELAALRQESLRLGADTKFSAGEAAAAIEILGKNGLNTAQILGGALSATVDLAAATGTTLANAADVASDAISQFGLKAGEVPRIVDQIANAASASKFGIDDFRLAMGQAGGVAGQVGVSFEDFVTSIAATAPAFTSGADAGTSFKTFLTALVPNTKASIAEMQQLGLITKEGANVFFDATGKMRPMAQVTAELAKAFSVLSDEQKIASADTIFGTDAMRTALGLAKEGTAGWARYAGEVAKTGTAAKQSAALMKGWNGAIDQLGGAFELLAIKIGDSGLLEWATSAVNALSSLVRSIADLDPTVLRFATALALVAAAAGPVLLAVGTLAKAGSTMITGWSALTRVLPGVATGLRLLPRLLMAIGGVATGPVGLVVAGATALYAAFKNWGAIKTFAGQAGTAIAAFATDAKVALGSLVTQGVDYVRTNWPRVYEAMSGASTALSLAIEGLVPALKAGLGTAIDAGRALWQGDFPKLFEIATSIAGTVRGKIAGFAGSITDGIATLVKAGADYWRSHFPESFEVATSIATTIKGKVAAFAGPVRQGVGALILAAQSLWAGDFPKAFAIAGSIGTTVRDRIAGFAVSVRDGVAALVDAGASYWQTNFPESFAVASSIAGTIRDKISAFAASVRDGVSVLIEAGRAIWTGDLPAAFAAGEAVGSAIRRAIGGLASWVREAATDLVSSAKAVWDDLLPAAFQVGQTVGSLISSAISGLRNAVTAGVAMLVSGAKEEWSTGFPTVFAVAGGIGTTISSAIGGLAAFITGALDGLTDGAFTHWTANFPDVFRISNEIGLAIRARAAEAYASLRAGIDDSFAQLKAYVASWWPAVFGGAKPAAEAAAAAIGGATTATRALGLSVGETQQKMIALRSGIGEVETGTRDFTSELALLPPVAKVAIGGTETALVALSTTTGATHARMVALRSGIGEVAAETKDLGAEVAQLPPVAQAATATVATGFVKVADQVIKTTGRVETLGTKGSRVLYGIKPAADSAKGAVSGVGTAADEATAAFSRAGTAAAGSVESILAGAELVTPAWIKTAESIAAAKRGIDGVAAASTMMLGNIRLAGSEGTDTFELLGDAIDDTGMEITVLGQTGGGVVAGLRQGWRTYYSEITDRQQTWADFSRDSLGAVQGGLAEFFRTGKLDFKSLGDTARGIFADLASKTVMDFSTRGVSAFADFLTGGTSAFSGVQQAGGTSMAGLGGTVAAMAGAAVSSFSGMGTSIQGVFSGLGTWLTSSVGGWGSIFAGLGTSVVSGLTTAGGAVQSLLSSIGSAAVTVVGSIGGSLIESGGAIADLFGDLFVYHEGGVAGGGRVGGTGMQGQRQLLDTLDRGQNEVVAVLERGEYVVNAEDAAANQGLLDAINTGGLSGLMERTGPGGYGKAFGGLAGSLVAGQIGGSIIGGALGRGQIDLSLAQNLQSATTKAGRSFGDRVGSWWDRDMPATTDMAIMERAALAAEELGTDLAKQAAAGIRAEQAKMDRWGGAFGQAGQLIGGALTGNPLVAGAIGVGMDWVGRGLAEVIGPVIDTIGQAFGFDPQATPVQSVYDQAMKGMAAAGIPPGMIQAVIETATYVRDIALQDAIKSIDFTTTERLSLYDKPNGPDNDAVSRSIAAGQISFADIGIPERLGGSGPSPRFENLFGTTDQWGGPTGGPGPSGGDGGGGGGGLATNDNTGGQAGGYGGMGGSGFGVGGMNAGGLIPGWGPDEDTVLAPLTRGEFVVRRREAQKHRGLLEAINDGTVSVIEGFNEGGVVDAGASRAIRGRASRAGGRNTELHFHAPVVANDLTLTQFARRIDREIRREQRRRTGSVG